MGVSVSSLTKQGNLCGFHYGYSDRGEPDNWFDCTYRVGSWFAPRIYCGFRLHRRAQVTCND